MKTLMNEENVEGDISRVIIRETEQGFQIDVLADGNQTGQEYSYQEMRMIQELLAKIDI